MRKLIILIILALAIPCDAGIIHFNTIRAERVTKNSVLIDKLKDMGCTFYADYTDSSLTADYAKGLGTATSAASRGASNPSTYVDGAGVVNKLEASNIGRFTKGYYDTTGFHKREGVLIEGAATNYLTYTIFNSDAGAGLATGWTHGDDITAAPTFTLIADGLTNISGSQAQRYQHVPLDGSFSVINSPYTAVGSIVQDDVMTLSMWLKGTTDATNFIIRWIENDAAAAAGTGHDSANLVSSLSATEWRRFTLTATAVDADCSRGLVQLNFSIGNGQTADIQVACVQLEKTPYATSFIPTTIAALTRNAETLKYAISGNRTAAQEACVVKIFTPFPEDKDDVYNIITDTDTKSRRFAALSDSFSRGRIEPERISSSGCVAYITQTSIQNTAMTLGYNIQHSSPYAEAYKDGVSVSTETADDFVDNAWGTYFWVGSNASGTAQLGGIIQSIAFFNRVLTGSEHLYLYTNLD